MRISKARQQAYRRELDGLAEDARSFAGSLLAAEMEAYPDASVAEMREMAKRAISDSLFAFGDQAATLAGELFDEITSAEGVTAKWVNEDTIDPAKMDSKVRYFADVLKGGATEEDKVRFRKDCTALTRDYVKRNAFENMIRNCDREKVRWARVPSGVETCSFCFMLASRGFDYLSKESADAVRHGRHTHCDCIIIPGVKGKTVIDGYDPDAMYDRWKQCADTVGVDPVTRSSAKRRRIMQEVETRDWNWLYGGEAAWRKHEQSIADGLNIRLEAAKQEYFNKKDAAGYEETYGAFFKQLSEEYGVDIKGQYLEGKGLSSAMPDGDEVWAAIKISKALGARYEFQGVSSFRSGNADLLDQVGYLDIKTPRGPKKVNARLRHAAEQCKAMGQLEGRAVLSALRHDGDFAESVEVAAKRLEEGKINEVILIWPDGRVTIMQ